MSYNACIYHTIHRVRRDLVTKQQQIIQFTHLQYIVLWFQYIQSCVAVTSPREEISYPLAVSPACPQFPQSGLCGFTGSGPFIPRDPVLQSVVFCDWLLSFIFKIILFWKSLLKCSCFTMLLVSTVQQSESAICLHISFLFWISFPFRSPQIPGHSFLCYTIGSQ